MGALIMPWFSNWVCSLPSVQAHLLSPVQIFISESKVEIWCFWLIHCRYYVTSVIKVVVYHYRPIFDKNKIQVKNIV